MKLQFIALLALCGLSVACSPNHKNSDSSQATEICQIEMQNRFDQLKTAQAEWYQAHGGEQPAARQQSQFYVGHTKDVVVLVHGFVSSPKYFEDLAHTLNEQGYSVVAPVLTGFGSSPEAANSATAEDWNKAIEDAVHVARACDEEPSIVAHSLGGALVTSEIENSRLGEIEKIVLLAPYFRTYSSYYGLLSQVAGWGYDVIDVETMRFYLGGRDPYGLVPLTKPEPGEREPFLPVVALNRVIALQYQFDSVSTKELSNGPEVLLVGSDADGVIDNRYALEYANLVFRDVRSIFYPAALKVKHSIMQPGNNPRLNELKAGMIAFLKN